MKILRPFCVVLASTVSLGVSAYGYAAEAEAHGNSVTAPASSSLMDTFQSIRSDLTKAEFTGEQMLDRIDSMIGQIDVQIQTANSAQKAELMKLRSSALQMRSRVVRFMTDNGSQLVQISSPVAPVPGGVEPALNAPAADAAEGAALPGGAAPAALGGLAAGTAPVAGGLSVGGGAVAAGGGAVAAGGGVAAASGLASGSLGLLSVGAAGVVATVEDNNDNDAPGIIASPAN